ncbi:MAG TPA: biotin synthase BioB, partial [Streptomyces sp.]|nr:biotin synthase BioB [Streptomyces sp.]
LEMIADAGFTVEGAEERTLPHHRADDAAGTSAGGGGGCGPCGGGAATGAGARAGEDPGEAVAPAAGQARTDLVAVRRRGAGTELPPNA